MNNITNDNNYPYFWIVTGLFASACGGLDTLFLYNLFILALITNNTNCWRSVVYYIFKMLFGVKILVALYVFNEVCKRIVQGKNTKVVLEYIKALHSKYVKNTKYNKYIIIFDKYAQKYIGILAYFLLDTFSPSLLWSPSQKKPTYIVEKINNTSTADNVNNINNENNTANDNFTELVNQQESTQNTSTLDTSTLDDSQLDALRELAAFQKMLTNFSPELNDTEMTEFLKYIGK